MLRDSAPNLVDAVVHKLFATVEELRPDGLLSAYAEWNNLEARIDPTLKASRSTTDDLIKKQGNLLHNRNKAIFAEMAAFLIASVKMMKRRMTAQSLMMIAERTERLPSRTIQSSRHLRLTENFFSPMRVPAIAMAI